MLTIGSSVIAQTKKIVSTYGELLDYPPSSIVSNSLDGVNLTTTVNGVTGSPVDISVIEPWWVMEKWELPATSMFQNIWHAGSVGIGGGYDYLNSKYKFQVSGKSIFKRTGTWPRSVLTIDDGYQKEGYVYTTDKDGNGSWRENGVLLVEGIVGGDPINFPAGGADSCLLSWRITLPKGKWLVNMGVLINPKIGETTVPNSNYAGRFTLSSDYTYIYNSFKFYGSKFIYNTASTGSVPGKYPLFVSGVFRVENTSDDPIHIYVWNSSSVGGAKGGKEIGGIANDSENYFYATKWTDGDFFAYPE